ncbi:MAG: type II toxin-antitoxin system VapC family toxin [Acidobacteriia bacterium]|nr:type II toxin-antitoxin system VapC family toxin [Terriglobia bacterium]
MRLLLDTHIWLWSLLDPSRLAPQVIAELDSSENEIWISPISVWESLILDSKGRIDLGDDPAAWVRQALARVPLREAALTHEISIRSTQMNIPHADPADRFLAATASVHELTLVTADERLITSRAISVFANRT